MLNKFFKVEFSIRTLLSLEKELNVPLDSLLFEMEITPEIQKIILYHGVKRSTKLGRQKIYEMYDNLSRTEKVKVDMKVNGRLLDSFGIGKKRESNADVSQETEVKFFSEYMTTLMFQLMSSIKLSKDDFLNSTPSEIFSLLDVYKKEQEFQFKLNQLAHINAIGLTSSKKFKEINPFNNKGTKKQKRISKEDKNRELDFLFNKVGE